MRLLNTSTLEVESITHHHKPAYAILSHRWTDDEVSFQEINSPAARTKRAFGKIESCCDMARQAGLTHVWIDTCCIDQTSSAELSEAINSMFRWYQEAKVCYAYLKDVTGIGDFHKSEWFDRGWTLQELLAPAEVKFFSKDWSVIGTRADLSATISMKTGIERGFLHGKVLGDATIAERMSWASKRITMREEDIAYCLLGLFGIHMPLLYGEGGRKAFLRLQKELLKEHHDHSWLAWQPTSDSTDNDAQTGLGVLASSPAQFAKSRDIVLCNPDSVSYPPEETAFGFELNLPIITRGVQQYALLDCRWRHDFTNVIAIPVIEVAGQYFRAPLDTSVAPESTWVETTRRWVVLSRSHKRVGNLAKDIQYIFSRVPSGFEIKEVFPPDNWGASSRQILSGVSSESANDSMRLVGLRYSAGISIAENYFLELRHFVQDGVQILDYRLGVLDAGSCLEELWYRGTPRTKEAKIPGGTDKIAIALNSRVVFNKPAFVVEISTRAAEAPGPSKVVSETEPLLPGRKNSWTRGIPSAFMIIGLLLFILLFSLSMFGGIAGLALTVNLWILSGMVILARYESPDRDVEEARVVIPDTNMARIRKLRRSRRLY